MLDTDGLPDYPPQTNAWTFPPPEVSRRWAWAAVLASVAAALLAGAMVTFLVVVSQDDFPGIIEDEELVSTISRECSLMTQTVESMPLSGPVERKAAVLRDQNRAIQNMLEAIRERRADEIVADKPAEQWLRDWELLIDARRDYSRELRRDPNATLVVPEDENGDEITERMRDVWLGPVACEVPTVLSDPEAAARNSI